MSYGSIAGRPSRRVIMLATLAALLLAAIPAGRFAYVQEAPRDPEYTLTNLTAQSQTAQVGDTFSESPGVRVCRYFTFPCQPVANVEVTFAAPAGNDVPSGTFADTGTHTTSVTSDSNGIAYAPAFTANEIAGGAYTVTATADEPFPELAVPYFFFFTNSEQPATNVADVSMAEGSNQASQINTSFALRFSVLAVDGSNNNLSAVEVTFEAPEEGPSGTFSSGSRTQTVNTSSTGIATASTFTANGQPGEYVVTATVSGDQTISGEPLTVTFALRNTSHNPAGVPELISVSAGGAQNVTVNTPYPTNLQVAVFDGNLDHVEGATVVFTLPDEGPSGTFAGGSSTFQGTTGSNGLVTASTLTSNSVVGQFAVEVTATKNDFTAEQQIALTIGSVETTTTLSKDPSGASVYGQPVEVLATIEAEEGNYVPTGPVTFYDGNQSIDECIGVSPTDGVATCVLEFLPVGNYTFGAEYLGDEVSFSSAAEPISHTVNKADTSVTLETSEPEFMLEGESVTFTATISVDPPGAGDPTGGVIFTSSDGTLLNGGDPVSLVDGEAQVSTSALDVGTPQITASYSGDDNFNGSNDDLTQHVYTVPEVTDNPSDSLVLVDDQASFSATATGTPDPEVQWQISTDGGESFEDIAGADEVPYVFSVVADDDQKQFRAVFTNPAGVDISEAATLTVRQLPEITSDDSATFTVGEEGTFTVTATGILEPQLSLDGTLPAGVEFDASTGVLSGTPDLGTGGVYPLTFTASNDVEPADEQEFSLTVEEAPEITSEDETTFIVDSFGSFTVTTTGQPVPDIVLSGALPNGVEFESSTGVLSGTPGSGAGGTYPLTIVASNGIEPVAEQNLTLFVHEAPEITSADSTTFVAGSDGNFSVTASGIPDPELELSGTLPDGLNFDESTGMLSGTPEAGTGGIYLLTITASNEVDPDAVQEFTLTVDEAPEITSDSSATFEVGEEGTIAVTATGHPIPVLSLEGTLPGGVSFDPDTGVLSGTPDVGTGGTYLLSLTASNGVEPDAGQTFTLNVNEAPSITSDDETTFEVGSSGSFLVTATGYPAPDFTLQGDLPGGLTFNEASGELSGTPADGTGGVYLLTVTAVNDVEPDAEQNFTLTVNEAPEITSADSTTFVFHESGEFTFTATGFPEPTFSVEGDLPGGITFDSSGLLSGTPEEAGIFSLTVTAQNGVLPNATQQFELTVDKATQEALTATVDPSSGIIGDRIQLGSTGGSGTGEVSFDAGSSDACELGTGSDAGMLVITDGTGTCEVVAQKAGDDFYHSATSEPTVVEVSRAEVSLTVDPANGTYSGTTSLSATLAFGDSNLSGKSINFVINDSEVGTAVTDANGVATLTDVDLSGINAGVYAGGVKASFDGDSAYLPADGSADLTVDKRAGRVSISNLPSDAIAGERFTPEYDQRGNGTPSVESLTPAICTVSEGTVHFDEVGTCELRAFAGEGSNHLAATGSVQSVAVEPRTAPTFAGVPEDLVVQATSVDGADVSYDVPTAEDQLEGSLDVDCNPPSGSTFPIGVTTVECTATNDAGLATTITFSVTVEPLQLPELDPIDGQYNPYFWRTWARTDKPVSDLDVSRTWMWGPGPFTESLWEPYLESPGGEREVIYFDKARAEINHPDGDPDSIWYVTNGLLVVEMITGQRQFGDDTFVDYGPAEVNVAGDPDDPNSPTYASFGELLDVPPQVAGTLLTQRLSRDGSVIEDQDLVGYGVSAGVIDEVTNHSIATPFWEFMNSVGLVYEDEILIQDALFLNPFYATGRPITEAYWATVSVGGQPRDVLMQCFERRCLTYTPGNPEGFVVEAGNVGQHYYYWRYYQAPDQ